jgi:archaellum component FlaG (FlaF/FlaG flagellin family)
VQYTESQAKALLCLHLRLLTAAVVAVVVIDKQVTYRLTEAQYAMNEATDPWAHELSQDIAALLQPYEPPAGLR